MAAQVDGAITLRSPLTKTAKETDETTLLSPEMSSRAKKKKNGSVKHRLGSFRRKNVCLKGLASPALYLIKKVKEMRSTWDNRNGDSATSEVVGVEPYFAIPVVVPVNVV